LSDLLGNQLGLLDLLKYSTVQIGFGNRMSAKNSSYKDYWKPSFDKENSLFIRKFKPRDLAEALEIDREVFGGYDPSIFATFYEYHSNTTLVALIDGKVVGFVLGFKHTFLEGRIFWLAVRPAYRSLGIATKLLASVLNNFKQMGAMSATLEVRVSNRRAQNLYSGLGFHMTGFFPNYYSDGEMALIMKKRL
jgi:[ribosomal protein S18]-alanine N-acetyltransferase